MRKNKNQGYKKSVVWNKGVIEEIGLSGSLLKNGIQCIEMINP